METYTWYESLRKPSFAPPAELFGTVWSILYPIIFITFGYVFYLFFTKKIPFMVFLPFLLNIFFNAAFTPIQFGLKNNLLASLDISLVIFTLIWAMYSIYPYASLVATAQFPYLFWGIFATILQLSITYLNK